MYDSSHFLTKIFRQVLSTSSISCCYPRISRKARSGSVLVIGAGVNGSICATRLHDAGVDVTVLARGQRYEAIPCSEQRKLDTAIHASF